MGDPQRADMTVKGGCDVAAASAGAAIASSGRRIEDRSSFILDWTVLGYECECGRYFLVCSSIMIDGKALSGEAEERLDPWIIYVDRFSWVCLVWIY